MREIYLRANLASIFQDRTWKKREYDSRSISFCVNKMGSAFKLFSSELSIFWMNYLNSIFATIDPVVQIAGDSPQATRYEVHELLVESALSRGVSLVSGWNSRVWTSMNDGMTESMWMEEMFDVCYVSKLWVCPSPLPKMFSKVKSNLCLVKGMRLWGNLKNIRQGTWLFFYPVPPILSALTNRQESKSFHPEIFWSQKKLGIVRKPCSQIIPSTWPPREATDQRVSSNSLLSVFGPAGLLDVWSKAMLLNATCHSSKWM